MGFMKPISRRLTERRLDLVPLVVMRAGPGKQSDCHLIDDGVISMSSLPKLFQMRAQSSMMKKLVCIYYFDFVLYYCPRFKKKSAVALVIL